MLITEPEFSLGDKAADTISGYEGTVTRRCEHMSGLVEYFIERGKTDDGSPEGYWFEACRLREADTE